MLLVEHIQMSINSEVPNRTHYNSRSTVQSGDARQSRKSRRSLPNRQKISCMDANSIPRTTNTTVTILHCTHHHSDVISGRARLTSLTRKALWGSGITYQLQLVQIRYRHSIILIEDTLHVHLSNLTTQALHNLHTCIETEGKHNN